MNLDLEGKSVLVTGGNRGIGLAIALAFAEEGANVAVCGRDKAALIEAEALIAAKGVKAKAVAVDLFTAQGCSEAVATPVNAFGGLDVLVASASSFEARAFADIDEAHIDAGLAVNLRAPLLLAQAAAPGMRAAGFGRIVFMSDVAGLEPWPRFLVHSVAKAGLVMLTRGLAQELAPEVTVNAIAPGTVLMPDGHTQAALRRSEEKSVLGRVGSPDDVAGALRYLLEADYVTGHTLVVDGGRLVRP